MTMTPILETLNKLERMHRSLLELTKQKTEYVKVGDMEQLDALLKKEQMHVAAIETLEKQRQQQVAEWLQAKGIQTPDTPTMTDVIEASEGDERQQLEQLRESLLAVVNELKERNLLNQKLVMQSLQFVNFSLDMLKPQRHQTNTFNYSGDEVRGQGTVGKKSYYDSQA